MPVRALYVPWYLNLLTKIPPCKWTVPRRSHVRAILMEALEENIRFLLHFKMPGSHAQTVEQFNCRDEKQLRRAIGEYNEFCLARPGYEISILKVIDLDTATDFEINDWLNQFPP